MIAEGGKYRSTSHSNGGENGDAEGERNDRKIAIWGVRVRARCGEGEESDRLGMMLTRKKKTKKKRL